LNLPENGLGNGSSGFAIGNGNGWLGTPGINSGPSRSPLGQHYNNDNDHDTAPLATDTLDYLGLADEGNGQPASMSEMRSQAQRAIAQSGVGSRNRASTVSNFGRPSSYRPNSAYRYDGAGSGQSADEELSRAIDSLGMGMGGYDDDDYSDTGSGHFYATAGIFNRDRDPNRPRSTTLGTVNDNPLRRGQSVRRAGYLASIPQSPVTGHMATDQSHNIFGYNPRSYSERDLTRSRESSSSRGPRHSHSISSHTSRTGTPDFDKVGQTPQMPTRSLWIGNLDVNATSDSLFQVFSPYGPIESVRLLPEKVGHVSIFKLTSRHAHLSITWIDPMLYEHETTSSIAWEVK
jgi:protein JSN1